MMLQLYYITTSGDEISDRIKSFFGKLSAGDGLRTVIDPLCNESGLYNQMECIRPSSENHNDQFKNFLVSKYSDILALNDNWKSNPVIPNFEIAAQLIPMYTTDKDAEGNYLIYCIDNSNNIYSLDGRNGVMWQDYLDFRDNAFADFNNSIAEQIKSGTDVPVILKNVWGYKRYFANDSTYLGIDGLGIEAYGDYSRIAALAVSTYGMASEMAKTAWIVATETQMEEDVSKKFTSGEYGYPSQEYMNDHFDTLFEYGAKGIYDFVLNAEHDSSIRAAYSYMNNRHEFQWLKEYRNSIDTNALSNTENDVNKIYLMPQDDNYYTSPNRGTCVLYDDSADTESFPKVGTGVWTMYTRGIGINEGIVAANFKDSPSSLTVGKQFEDLISKDGIKAVYLGERKDLGSTELIDKYFTSRISTNDEGIPIQVLQPDNDCEILCQNSQGEVWALRKGNLWIVSAINAYEKYYDYISDMRIFYAEMGLKIKSVEEYENGYIISGSNNTGAAVTAMMYTAVYNNGILEKADAAEIILPSGGFSIKTEIDKGERVFLWDKDMQPILYGSNNVN